MCWPTLVLLGCLLCWIPQISRSQDFASAKLWTGLKAQLSGPKGAEFFEQLLKGARLPVLEGTLISSTPANQPREFLIAISDDKIPEVTLRLEGHLQKSLPVGTPVSFDGVAEKFTPSPFMLTLSVETVNRAMIPDEKTAPSTNTKKKSK